MGTMFRSNISHMHPRAELGPTKDRNGPGRLTIEDGILHSCSALLDLRTTHFPRGR